MQTQLHIVSPGEIITNNAEEFLKGHGTYEHDGKMISCICGVVEKIGKLISVRPLRSRYIPNVGDVVVGRIMKVSAKRWLVDVQGQKEASLLLSSINLQGHDNQRRKTYEDQLNMRNMFVENDLIVAEVQQVSQQEGTASLQTRSQRYGKLSDGQLIMVDATLVKRCKQHFIEFDFGIDIIMGKNGYIFISASKKNKPQKDRELMARVRNSIQILASESIPIWPETILDVYHTGQSIHPRDFLLPENIGLLVHGAIERVNEIQNFEGLELNE
jgi:exosome complex component RRP4